ncbi:MAG: hypothetical protein JNJ85_09535 [Candidatus Kapabacteria bacterium]|nr:hypothetical protein [Candidatus Kapabacteria bacterium]
MVLLASCTEGNVISSAKDIVFPDSNVKYQQQVQPWLALSCNFTGCHADGSQFPFTSYITLINTPGLIIFNKPESSRLTQVINGTLAHRYDITVNMTENHKKGMNTWIREGAKNN